jgi:hypothetical protein
LSEITRDEIEQWFYASVNYLRAVLVHLVAQLQWVTVYDMRDDIGAYLREFCNNPINGKYGEYELWYSLHHELGSMISVELYIMIPLDPSSIVTQHVVGLRFVPPMAKREVWYRVDWSREGF